VLQRGDAFGEAGLLGEEKRTATVRARSQVEVLRLHASVFSALARSYPQLRTVFETMGRTRTLSDFFRINVGFASLPADALGKLIAGLEPAYAAAGETVMREGDPPGAMYVVEAGRLRAFRTHDVAEQNVGFLRTGDFFGERSLFRSEPRTATIEALDDCKLLRLPPELYATLLAEYPEFRERMQERITQYDYQRIARVPLDFADEILPAAASATEGHRGPGAEPPGSRTAEQAAPGAGGRPDASRTSSSSTRWTAAPRVSA
jgi:CRP-like cAMP-binding protein